MTDAVRSQLAAMAQRRKWDAAALYAVVSILTGRTFRPDAGAERWTPTATAIGLWQMREEQARLCGIAPSPHPPRRELAKFEGRWATWALAAMTVDDQVEVLERYLVRTLGERVPARPVDYYLAAWGAAPGLPEGTIIAVEGDSSFERARALDGDHDGKIAVRDLKRALDREIKRTNVQEPGVFFDALWTLFVFGIGRRFLK